MLCSGDDGALFGELDDAAFRVAEVRVGADAGDDDAAAAEFAEHAFAILHRDVEVEVADRFTVFALAEAEWEAAEFHLAIAVSAFADHMGVEEVGVEVTDFAPALGEDGQGLAIRGGRNRTGIHVTWVVFGF